MNIKHCFHETGKWLYDILFTLFFKINFNLIFNFFSADLLYDLSMGQNVQNPWKGISAVPSSGHGAFNEDSFN